MLALSSRLLTPSAVDGVIAPTLDDVLVRRPLRDHLDRLRDRAVVGLARAQRGGRHRHDHVRAGRAARHPADPGALVRALPGLPARRGHPAAAGAGRPGPGGPDRCRTGWRSSATSTGRWCCVGSVCLLATLYHLAVPVRTRWRADLPGAALTLLIWLGGSALLRLVLGLSIGSTSIYGPLAAPIAVLIWLYLISLAVLIGAAFNASLDAFPDCPDRASATRRGRPRHRCRTGRPPRAAQRLNKWTRFSHVRFRLDPRRPDLTEGEPVRVCLPVLVSPALRLAWRWPVGLHRASLRRPRADEVDDVSSARLLTPARTSQRREAAPAASRAARIPDRGHR